MSIRNCFLAAIFLALPVTLCAQTSDFGAWSTIGLEKKLGKWSFNGEAELRANDNVGSVNRWSLLAGADYNFMKPLKLGFAYQFINFHDVEYSDYQPRQRYILFLQGKQKFGRFTFTLRERFQRTIKDESDRLKENGNYDNYRVNPEWVWRNRIKASYNIPHFPVTPSLAFETFYELNDPDGNSFSKLRYTLAFTYKVAKHHELEFYGLTDHQINVNNSETLYVAGMAYKFSF